MNDVNQTGGARWPAWLRPEKRRKSAYRAVIGGGKVDHAGGRLLRNGD